MIRAASLVVVFAALVAAQEPATPESFCTIPPAVAQEKVSKEHGAGFALVETKHFRLISDSCPRYRKLIAGGLEQFYGLVHDRFFKKEMKPVVVFLIDGADDYDAFCRKHGHADLGGGGYGLYVPGERAIYTRRLMPDGSLSGFGTLFHEAIHAMVHADFDFDPPSWFNEGFASLFEQGRIVKGGWVYGNPNPWREAPYRAAFEAGRIPPLAKYFGLSERDFRGSDELLNYNTGRSVCLWLLLQGEPKLAKYVDLVRQKKGGVAAIEAASGKKLADVEKAWREHVKAVHFGGDYVYRAQHAKGDEALKILEDGMQKHPDYGVLHFEAAQRYAAEGRRDPAEREALAALKDPRLPMPSLAWSVLLWCRSGDSRKEIEAARQVVEMQPWFEVLNEKAYQRLASLLEADGKAEEAKRISTELARLQEESQRAQPK
jgi:hypothetical protein